ncbi:hypothetical protein [Halioxenophilus sp. WMMB6]|uniref:hypothetical protein n=1 Tax=Halioxenophilus sp. WMMB6 TaxID=3073815 RepID=UPI00295E9A05|nr:hypothetical protein [Halioxenophilus sp. WMMB6]
MTKAVFKWVLALSFTSALATHAVAESLDQAQAKLQQLEQELSNKAPQIAELEQQMPELTGQVTKAEQLLAEKQTEMEATGSKMQAAIALNYEKPNPDNEREASKLSREFTLAELTVSRAQLELDRAARAQQDLAQQIDNLRAEESKAAEAVTYQKGHIAQMRAEMAQADATKRALAARADADKRRAEAEARAAREAALAVNETPAKKAPESKPAPAAAPEKKPEEKETPSIEEQRRNINKVINSNSGWGSSDW